MLAQPLNESVPAETMTIAVNDISAERDFLAASKARVVRLHTQSRQGLWHIAAFLLISIGFLYCRDINILGHFSEATRVVLGAPPAPFLIHIVLAVSTISALIVTAGKLANNEQPGRKWEQVAYRSVFYLFYFLSNVLDRHFMVVLVAGLLVLLLEHCQIWTYFRNEIKKENELMRKVSLWPLLVTSANK